MLGIKQIASYLPDNKISNYDKKEKFELDDDFIENKIGVKFHALKEKEEKASDLCVKAFTNLTQKLSINKDEIDCCVVVTQNPDFNIPHTSAIVHGKLELPQNCACFDISLGCSGYVYGLSNIISFMKNNNLKNGLLFTADPYSDIIDNEDKNTALLFGDGATVTYINEDGTFVPKDFSFGTNGKDYRELLCEEKLYMNGRAVFNFAATTIPKHIEALLHKNNLENSDIDKYVLHQGSKYIVDTIRKRLKVDESKVPFDMHEYGNTVSSSIPIILEKEIIKEENRRFLISGFGVGLSWGSAIIEKV
ncbi:ketoacyl-ACP synthase III [Sulfurimonas crateris]|uniref:Ketoacyl-ACP synthase III n=1 Tax=Sulfurimonas crateris TaxID=2574727 RepID=A0A4U2ZBJ8_9BACT|nr:ketoacyl-ACP synthase III [Sulfurimonas crateris]TKI71032.1 ketoacyl-ACP synthase III [Sulfurimonas crateris]